MWKIVCLAIFLVPLISGAKIGQLIGPISSGNPDDPWPVFGSYYTNKYAKIAREIVHNASKYFIFLSSVHFECKFKLRH